jgi:hypothetical protein
VQRIEKIAINVMSMDRRNCNKINGEIIVAITIESSMAAVPTNPQQ